MVHLSSCNSISSPYKAVFWVNTTWHDLHSLLEGSPLCLVYFDINHVTVKPLTLLFFYLDTTASGYSMWKQLASNPFKRNNRVINSSRMRSALRTLLFKACAGSPSLPCRFFFHKWSCFIAFFPPLRPLMRSELCFPSKSVIQPQQRRHMAIQGKQFFMTEQDGLDLEQRPSPSFRGLKLAPARATCEFLSQNSSALNDVGF